MEFLQLNGRIREFFGKHNFKELSPVLFLKNNTLQSPNLLFFIVDSMKKEKAKAIIIDGILNKDQYILATPKMETLLQQHLSGVVKGYKYNPVDLIKELIGDIIGKSVYWETREVYKENKILGIKLYGWDIYVDGYSIGFTGYIDRFAKQKLEDTMFFDISLDGIQQVLVVTERMPITGEYSHYLFKHSSKKMLFDTFDNYLEEALHCIKINLGKTGFIFLMQSYSIYQLLLARGNISKTEKIGYDKKIASLIQKCIEGNITGGLPLS